MFAIFSSLFCRPLRGEYPIIWAAPLIWRPRPAAMKPTLYQLRYLCIASNDLSSPEHSKTSPTLAITSSNWINRRSSVRSIPLQSSAVAARWKHLISCVSGSGVSVTSTSPSSLSGRATRAATSSSFSGSCNIAWTVFKQANKIKTSNFVSWIRKH